MSVQTIGVDLTAVGTAQLFSPGTIHFDKLGRCYQYCKCSSTIAQYSYVRVSHDSTFTVVVTNDTNVPSAKIWSVGCTQNALSSGQYGWVFRGYGLHTGLFAASCVQNVKILTTNTDGVVDDAGTTGILGLSLITTITGAAASPAWAATRLGTYV